MCLSFCNEIFREPKVKTLEDAISMIAGASVSDQELI